VRIRSYIKARLAEGAGGRTINIEADDLITRGLAQWARPPRPAEPEADPPALVALRTAVIEQERLISIKRERQSKV
jgi:hypothetical protein